MFSVICLRFQLQVVRVEHRPGVLMGAIDALSRDLEHDLDPSLFKEIVDNGCFARMMAICDPVLMDQANLGDHHIALVIYYCNFVVFSRGHVRIWFPAASPS